MLICYPVTLHIITCVIKMHVGDYYGMNMFSTRIIFLFMDQEFCQVLFENRTLKIYSLDSFVLSTNPFTLILFPMLSGLDNMLLISLGLSSHTIFYSEYFSYYSLYSYIYRDFQITPLEVVTVTHSHICSHLCNFVLSFLQQFVEQCKEMLREYI